MICQNSTENFTLSRTSSTLTQDGTMPKQEMKLDSPRAVGSCRVIGPGSGEGDTLADSLCMAVLQLGGHSLCFWIERVNL